MSRWLSVLGPKDDITRCGQQVRMNESKSYVSFEISESCSIDLEELQEPESLIAVKATKGKETRNRNWIFREND